MWGLWHAGCCGSDHSNYSSTQSKRVKTSPACARRVLCAGHSLGAAIATLCGPWAKATFPNVRLSFGPSCQWRAGILLAS